MSDTKHTPPELEAYGPYVSARRGDTSEQVADCSVSSHGNAYAKLIVAAISAIREIASADPVDMALDPTWAKRIALAAAEGRIEEREG